ncbi:unnamed protein product [Lupinus luteus]
MELAISHFCKKNRIIAELKALYPEDEWDFSPLIRDKFFGGRQVNREYSLKFLDQMREDLTTKKQQASCATRLHRQINTWNLREEFDFPRYL